MKTVRIDLPEQGGWAEVRDPSDWTQRKFTDWIKRAGDLRLNPNSTGAETWFREVIDAWHLINPDTGEALNNPETDDLGSLKVSTVNAITRKAVDLVNASVSFPSS